MSFKVPLAAVLYIVLVCATLPATTQEASSLALNRSSAQSPSFPLSTAPPAGVPTADVAVLPDGPVDESIESLLGDTSKLQLTAEVASAATLADLGLPVAQKFQAWAIKYNKKYSGAVEKVKRLLVFAANLAFIEAHNLKHPDEKLKLNAFSAMSFEEFKAAYGAPRRGRLSLRHWRAHNGGIAAPMPPLNGSTAGSGSSSGAPNITTAAGGKPGLLGAQVPSSFDWTARRVVTTPRQQGKCGECTVMVGERARFDWGILAMGLHVQGAGLFLL